MNVKDLFKPMVEQPITHRCAALFYIHRRDIVSPYKFKFIMPARFALYKAIRNQGFSYPNIGKLLERDHASIYAGIQRAEYMMERDEEYAAKVEELTKIHLEMVYAEL